MSALRTPLKGRWVSDDRDDAVMPGRRKLRIPATARRILAQGLLKLIARQVGSAFTAAANAVPFAVISRCEAAS